MIERIVGTVANYGYLRLYEDLFKLKQAFSFLEVQVIGESVLGRKIPAVRIGTGSKEIHYNAAFHANEWITTPLLMRFIDDTADAYYSEKSFRGKNMKRILSEVSLWIVPMVNPDGVELVLNGLAKSHPRYDELYRMNKGSLDFRNWKANIRGVDLNDQFPAYWAEERERRAVSEPGERDYAGESPLTEPEAAAMAAFTKAHNFELVMAFHTQGQEIYWNYRDMEPLRSIVLAEVLAQASGYKAVKLIGSDAGYKDWFIQEFSRPGFTVEVGAGTNPLPIETFPQLYEEVVGIMLEGLCM
jgi:g-D-glutamyl-meso-diaminopimelate peptidase